MAYPPISGPASGPREAVLAYARSVGAKRLDEVAAFVDELYDLAPRVGFDPYLIAVQSAHETGDPKTGAGWRSSIWETRLNPAGLGVTDGPDDGISFANGRDAARAILVHHAAYSLGSLPEALKPFLLLDPRFQAVFKAGFAGTVKTWGDYGRGKWASDPSYADQIVRKAKDILSFAPVGGAEEEPTTMPNIIDKWLDVTQDGYAGVVRYYKNRSGYNPKIIVLHIQEGTNWGSWQHFHSVTASATVFVGRNGDIWRLVREEDAPWTNGDTCSATAKGRDILNRFGPDPNYYTLSIETEGYASDNNPYGWLAWPKPQAQLDAIVWQVKTWMQKYDIPKELVVRHADLNQCSRPGCPGDTLYNYVMAHIDGAPVSLPPVYAAPRPIVINGVRWDGQKTVVVGGVTFNADNRKVTGGAKGAECHLWASFDSELTRKNVAAGETFTALGWVKGEERDGEARWWVTDTGTRVWCGGTKEKPKSTSDQPKENPFDKLVNGVRFKAIRADGKPATIKVTVPVLNVRKWATSDAAQVRSPLVQGQTFDATYWVKGENVNGNDIWLVTPYDSRIWSGGTDFKVPA